MRRVRRMGQDTYGDELKVGDTVVFSWGGSLHRAKILEIQMKQIYCHLIVRPEGYENQTHWQTKEPVTAKVKNSRTVVKVC